MEKKKFCLWKLQLGFWTYGLIHLLGPSSLNEVSRPQAPRSIFFFFFEISWFYWIHLLILEKIRSCLWKLQLGFWTYGFIPMNWYIWLGVSSDPKWPKFSFWAPDPKVKTFFEILWFCLIYLMILEKMRSCLWKLKLGFWTCGLIHLLGPSGPNVVSGPQTPR